MILLCGLTACSRDVEPPRGTSPFERAGGREPATVWAVGDAAQPDEGGSSVARLIARAHPDHLLYLGDVYETGIAEEFATYGELYGELAPMTSPTPGNHDWDAHEHGYDQYWGQPPESRAAVVLLVLTGRLGHHQPQLGDGGREPDLCA